jgi:hypothetical protein
MTTIKMLRDDEGVLSLQRQNKATIDLEGDVEEVEPYPTIRPMAPRLPESPPRSRDRRRHTAPSKRYQRGPDRRRQQRRQHDIPVLLDTRAPFERRNRLRRDNDQRPQDTSDRPLIGFDKFA